MQHRHAQSPLRSVSVVCVKLMLVNKVWRLARDVPAVQLCETPQSFAKLRCADLCYKALRKQLAPRNMGLLQSDRGATWATALKGHPMQLQHSLVRRRGVKSKSKRWYGRTEHITAIKNVGDGFNFKFTLPSKGGGNTRIELVVAGSDLRELLSDLARRSPGMAPLFASCTQAAVAALMAAPPADEVEGQSKPSMRRVAAPRKKPSPRPPSVRAFQSAA